MDSAVRPVGLGKGRAGNLTYLQNKRMGGNIMDGMGGGTVKVADQLLLEWMSVSRLLKQDVVGMQVGVQVGMRGGWRGVRMIWTSNSE